MNLGLTHSVGKHVLFAEYDEEEIIVILTPIQH